MKLLQKISNKIERLVGVYSEKKAEAIKDINRNQEFSFYKFVYIVISHFWRDKSLTAKASALTFYTLTSILPAFSLLLALIKGFNILDDLENLVIHVVPVASKSGVDDFMLMADRYLSNTSFLLVNVCLALWGCYKLKNCSGVFL